MRFIKRVKRVVYSPHFWVIAVITAFLIVVNNSDYLNIYSHFPWFKKVLSITYIYNLHRSLFIIPILYAAAVFQFPGVLIVSSIFLAVLLPRVLYESVYPNSFVRTMVFVFISIIAGVMTALVQNRRERERKALLQLESERQIYLEQVIKAQEEERHRIARELHDETTQSLLVIANRAHNLCTDHYSSEIKGQAENIRDMVLGVTEEVRRLSHDLRPTLLDTMGLLPALKWLAEHLSKEGGIKTSVIINGMEQRLRPEAEVVFFRIVQEALNNIRKHSKATTAVVSLEFDTDRFRVTVWNNGQSFHLPEKMGSLVSEGKLGLAGMQQRARLLGGTFSIQSDPDHGTSVVVEAKI